MTHEELERIPFIVKEIKSVSDPGMAAKLQAEIDRAEAFINSAPGEMGSILRMKYLYGMKNQDIADKLGFERTSIGKKLKNFPTFPSENDLP